MIITANKDVVISFPIVTFCIETVIFIVFVIVYVQVEKFLKRKKISNYFQQKNLISYCELKIHFTKAFDKNLPPELI